MSHATPARTKSRTLFVDKVGAWLGFTCAVHCLAMPLLVGVLPLVGLGFLADEAWHRVIIGSILATALAGALWGYQRHRELRVVMAFIGAMALLFIGRTFGDHETWGRVFAIAGGIAIACSHLVSARLCRRCGEQTHACDNH